MLTQQQMSAYDVPMKIIEQALEKSRLRQRLPAPATRRALREHAGVSQDTVGKAVGVTRAEVSKWESGSRSPRDGNLDRYLQVLDRLESLKQDGAEGRCEVSVDHGPVGLYRPWSFMRCDRRPEPGV